MAKKKKMSWHFLKCGGLEDFTANFNQMEPAIQR